jgi:hypothetical protein
VGAGQQRQSLQAALGLKAWLSCHVWSSCPDHTLPDECADWVVAPVHLATVSKAAGAIASLARTTVLVHHVVTWVTPIQHCSDLQFGLHNLPRSHRTSRKTMHSAISFCGNCHRANLMP